MTMATERSNERAPANRPAPSLLQRLVNLREHSLREAVSGPHSMEHVATKKGVEYINDSRSTFLDASLRSLAEVGKRTVWIAGASGADATNELIAELLDGSVGAIVFFGSNTEPLIEGLPEAIDQVFYAQELRTAVFLARELAASGDAVLFSPGCPSGEGFANYEERGYEFKRAVNDL
jgi:UDP-N-acetylmuramoylalanine--D-glutamate ligase